MNRGRWHTIYRSRHVRLWGTNVPGLSARDEFQISRRLSGTFAAAAVEYS